MNKDKYCEHILDLVIERGTEVSIKNGDPVPIVFYIGTGRSGSASIMYGLSETTAHWHNEKYFSEIYRTDILIKNSICLYDLVTFIGRKYDFKPLIIESFREPVARSISLVGQSMFSGEKIVETYDDYVKEIGSQIEVCENFIYSLRFRDYFGVDLLSEFDGRRGYFYKELDNAKLLLLKCENSSDWEIIFSSIGYKFADGRMNNSQDRGYRALYQEVLSRFRMPLIELDALYGQEAMRVIYTDSEIQEFKNKWRTR